MQIGDVIAGDYRLEERLGAGAFGTVWRATQLSLDRAVAIKILNEPQRDTLVRFDQEARALARLSHPNCVTVFGTGSTDAGTRYLVMELAGGSPLSEHRGKQLPAAEVYEVVRQIASALAAARVAGVAHRDLKPENIVLSREPSGLQLKVLDFGLAKLYGLDQVDVTATGEVFGTPQYMSPEQLRGSRDAGPPSDVYALGVIAFEILEGRLPFNRRAMLELALAHMSEPPPPITRTDVSAEFVALVAAMLSKDPARRPSAHQIVAFFQTPAPSPAYVDSRSPFAAALVAGAAVVIVIAVMAVMFTQSRDAQPAEPSGHATVESEANTSTQTVEPTGALPEEVRAKPELADDGCIPRLEPGLHIEHVDDVVTSRPVAVYVPRGERPATGHPSLFLFHRRYWERRANAGESFLNALEIQELADRHSIVVIAPTSETAWENVANEIDFVDQLRQWATGNLCLSESQRFAMGYATGGDFVRRSRCELAWAGTAAMSSAITDDEELCNGPKVPHIRIQGVRDVHVPREGGGGCPGNSGTRSSADISEMWRRHNGASGALQAWVERQDGRCSLWRGETAFASCEMSGGRYLASDQKRQEVPGCEESRTPNTFPVGEVIIRFFREEAGL